MTITDEAVEAAASQLFDQDFAFAIWGETCEPVREQYRAKAIASLEAAAPHMLAEAWELGREVGLDQDFEATTQITNPYRPTP